MHRDDITFFFFFACFDFFPLSPLDALSLPCADRSFNSTTNFFFERGFFTSCSIASRALSISSISCTPEATWENGAVRGSVLNLYATRTFLGESDIVLARWVTNSVHVMSDWTVRFELAPSNGTENCTEKTESTTAWISTWIQNLAGGLTFITFHFIILV
jgi:hypothetical protein